LNIVIPSIFSFIAGIAAVLFALRADLHRRKLSLSRTRQWHVLSALDLACPSITIGVVFGLIPADPARGNVPLYSPVTWAIAAGALIFIFLWREGWQQIRFQRPAGIVFGEWLILAGAYQVLESAIFRNWPRVPHGPLALAVSVSTILAGGIVIAIIVPPFVKRYEGRRILDRIADVGESVQPEYVPATFECPHPELWHMADSQTSELEVVDFLRSIIMTVKPHLIVETGTFIGYSAVSMAEGLKANGFGRLITIEYDPVIFAKAKDRIDSSGLGNWIECRNESSLDTQIEGTIDILFSDSHLTIREDEIRRFLPQINPQGLILIHDASSHFGVVREAALRLEQEGLISVVLLSTPRGLVVAQKRAGRR
jgi:predicted O-methyltransferase YrrM